MIEEVNRVIINLDGTKIKLVGADLDGDGVVGGVETVQRSINADIINPKETTELGDAIVEMNKDSVKEGLSSMDFLSRINKDEISAMVALDTLIGMGVLPIEAGILNRVKMRKSVSLSGMGREEMRDIIIGQRQQQEGMGAWQKMKNFVGGGSK